MSIFDNKLCPWFRFWVFFFVSGEDAVSVELQSRFDELFIVKLLNQESAWEKSKNASDHDVSSDNASDSVVKLKGPLLLTCVVKEKIEQANQKR